MANKKPQPKAAPNKKSPRERSGPTRQERLEAARASRARKQQLTRWGVPAVIILVLLGFAIVTTRGSGADLAQDEPSDPKDVTIDGPALKENLPAGSTVPNFSAPALGGEGDISWADYDGVPRVLSIWAPWCPHCQKELPIIGKVAEDFPGVQIVTVATAVGAQPGGPTPKQFIDERSLQSFPVAMDDSESTLASGLGVKGFPTVYFVSSDGTVMQSMDGERTEDVWRAAFEEVDATAVDASPSPAKDGGSKDGGSKGDEPVASSTPEATSSPAT